MPRNDQVDELDPNERNNDTTKAIDEQVTLQDRERANRLVRDAAQRKWNQRDNNQGVENDSAQDRAGRAVQVHDVQRRNRRERRHQHRRNDRKIFRHIVGDAEGRQATARNQHLLPDLDDVEQFGGIAVEIDHIASFARGLRAGIHRDTHIGLCERRCIVRPVTGHGDEMAVRLFLTDPFQFLFRRRLSHEIVHAGFGGDGRGSKRIIAGDHHRSDSHLAQCAKRSLIPPLTTSLSSIVPSVIMSDCNDQWRAARCAKFRRLSFRLAAGRLRRLIQRIRAWLRPRLCA